MPSLKGTETEQNLKDALAAESQANRRHLCFAEKADVVGFNDLAAVFRSTAEGKTGHAHGHLDWFETLAKAGKSHVGRFQKALGAL
jgi:rubrerythrin